MGGPGSGLKDPKSQHVLTGVDEAARTGVCSLCGPIDVHSADGGRGRKRWRCNGQRRLKARGRIRRKGIGVAFLKAVILLTDHCPRCGVLIEDPCMLDADHVIPKHQGGTDTVENLQLLCANCHRLKTKLERYGALPEDFSTRYPLT